MNVEDVKKLTVEVSRSLCKTTTGLFRTYNSRLYAQKLKVELKARDLDTTGKKAELAERLETYLQAQPAEPSVQANGAATSSAAKAETAAPAAGKVRHNPTPLLMPWRATQAQACVYEQS